jgi:hypothetical protein
MSYSAFRQNPSPATKLVVGLFATSTHRARPCPYTRLIEVAYGAGRRVNSASTSRPEPAETTPRDGKFSFGSSNRPRDIVCWIRAIGSAFLTSFSEPPIANWAENVYHGSGFSAFHQIPLGSKTVNLESPNLFRLKFYHTSQEGI